MREREREVEVREGPKRGRDEELQAICSNMDKRMERRDRGEDSLTYLCDACKLPESQTLVSGR